MDEKTLISLVEKYPALYDHEDTGYHDDKRRMIAWNQIAGILDENINTCKEKWRKLRENYRKANILRNNNTDRQFKPIRYDKELRFLKPYIQDEPEQTLPTLLYDDQSEYHSKLSPKPAKKKKIDKQEERDTEESNQSTHESFTYNIEEKRDSPPEKEDPIVTFFKNLGQTVKEFPPDLRVRVKRAVFNVVSEAEEEVIERTNQRVVFANTVSKVEINPFHSD